MTWLSRTVAVVGIMVGPGLVGLWLDRRWNSSLCTPIGFLLGMALATTALVAIARKLTPPAHGKPLPFDDETSATDEPGDQFKHNQADTGRDELDEDLAGGGPDDATRTP